MKLQHALILVLFSAMHANAAPVVGIEISPNKPYSPPSKQVNAGWSGDSMINYSGTVNTPVSSVNIDLSPIAGSGGGENKIPDFTGKSTSRSYTEYYQACWPCSDGRTCCGQRQRKLISTKKFETAKKYVFIINYQHGINYQNSECNFIGNECWTSQQKVMVTLREVSGVWGIYSPDGSVLDWAIN